MKNEFILGVLDTQARIKNPLAESFCRNLMEYWMVEYSTLKIAAITDSNPEEILRKAAASPAKWLIFAALGSSLENRYPFLAELKKFLAENPNFFVMGHILDRKQHWYELHDQCFILNLEMYRQIGCPPYGQRQRGSYEMMCPERSTENFHDDYTPLWVKPSNKFAMYTGLENGHGLITAGLRENLPLLPFPTPLRESKFCFSPTVSGAFAKKYWWLEERLRSSDRLFYAFNTEELKLCPPNLNPKPLKRLYALCSGLMVFNILREYPYGPGCRVHFFDSSPVALIMMKKIIRQWDGRDYLGFLRKNLPEDAVLFGATNTETKWHDHLQSFGGEEKWLAWFKKVTSECVFDFHEANVFKEGFARRPWLQLVGNPSMDSMLWLSNVFHFHSTSAHRSLEERFEIQKSLIRELAAIQPDMLIHMMSCVGDRDLFVKNVFRASEYESNAVAPPRLWDTRPARYPIPVRQFFDANFKASKRIRPRPQEFAHIQLHNLHQISAHQLHQFSRWIEHESHTPSLRLDLDIPYQEMLNEARACHPHFVKHREELNPGWESLCLHGISARSTEDYREYGLSDRSQAQFKWTEIADICPITSQWLRTKWPMQSFDRVRFMLLRPGGYIQAHNDMNGKRGLHATNIALNQPEDCEMVLEEYGIIPWQPGDIRRLDIGVNHSVYNGSTEDRYHMIIHGDVGDRVRDWDELIVRSFLKGERHD